MSCCYFISSFPRFRRLVAHITISRSFSGRARRKYDALVILFDAKKENRSQEKWIQPEWYYCCKVQRWVSSLAQQQMHVRMEYIFYDWCAPLRTRSVSTYSSTYLRIGNMPVTYWIIVSIFYSAYFLFLSYCATFDICDRLVPHRTTWNFPAWP